tara:strand:+ start:1293 stop:1814 length:522 start_codon:yes stop_codon:yes gene_type:complete
MNSNNSKGKITNFFYKVILYCYLKLFRLIHTSRANMMFSLLAECGKDTIFDDDIVTNRPENIFIGSRVFIGKRVIIDAYGKIEIGDDCSIAADCKIISGNHNIDRLDTPINTQGYEIEDIKIEKNVWLGFNVLIMPGVSLGSGTVVGAGSVVTKSFPKNSVIAGSPAKLIKSR